MKASPEKRYQHKPFVGSSHTWAKDRLLQLPQATPILDIGSGSGVMGSFLKDNGFQAVSAVEIDEKARDHARSIYSRMEASIDSYAGQTFGAVLMMDVLEHMSDPFSFLKQVTALLAPRGLVFISLPNIAHWSVRFPLLFGYFPYAARGILDETHLQFFTRNRVLKLVHHAECLEVVEFGASISPMEFALPQVLWDNVLFRTSSRVRHTVTQWLPGLLGYQHLLVARKK